MTPAAGFLAGLGCGLTLLVAGALRPVSPRWLRMFLLGLMLLQAAWLSLQWMALALPATVGVLVASVFAVDQLLRHPAMSPKRLLRWCGPLLVLACIISAALFVGPGLIPETAMETLVYPAYPLILILAGVGFIGWASLLLPKISSWVMRRAVCCLVAAHALAVGQVVIQLQHMDRPLAFRPDLLLLLALWYVYDLAYRLGTNR